MHKYKNIFLKILIVFLLLSIKYANSQANNIPVANYDIATADVNTTLNVPSGAPDNYTSLLDNDFDADGDTLSVVRFSINGGVSWTNAGGTINIVGVGTITINSDGTYNFVPTTGYTGYVPDIIYEVTDGEDTSMATLFLTVETNNSIIEIQSFLSCNQGYTIDPTYGEVYKIQHTIWLKNTSITRAYHENSNVTNIQIFNDLEASYGDGCIVFIEKGVGTRSRADWLGGSYPEEWSAGNIDEDEFSETDATPGADGIFNTTNSKLYPGQLMVVTYCVYVNPFCNGRPNPTPSGSGIDFTSNINLTSDRGNDTETITIPDFHTTETTVAAKLNVPGTVYVQDLGLLSDPAAEPDITYDYVNTVTIKNDGLNIANNVNYNMGLGSFLDNGITFSTLTITQDSGPAVTINPLYNGDNETLLLTNGNSLNAGEIVVLKIHTIVNPLPSTLNMSWFNQLGISMTQFPGFERNYSYVIWSDDMGDHLDRYYYQSDGDNSDPTSNSQCSCVTMGMRFFYNATANINKTLESNNPAPSGILEHKELIFKIRIGNDASSTARINNLVLSDNLLGMCPSNIVSLNDVTIELPTGVDEIPETSPNLNIAYDGVTDINLFDGTSGILNPGEFLDVLITVTVKDDCYGTNLVDFNGADSLSNLLVSVGASTNISVFSDSDNDGVTNINDIDDDNDGVPDTVEYNGLDPLDDADNDDTPNYRDTDFGVDSNADGIVDLFDFDMDGVPNHFDLDSDNDGIFDIVETGNGALDTSSNGQTNSAVGLNGLDDSLENVDDLSAIINYTIPNSDTDANPNYLDIDSDNDGIVDNIEAQSTDSYLAPNAPDANGVVYTNGLTPVDTDSTSAVPDGIPDYLDSDSDDDLRDDSIEAWDFNNDGVPETNFTNTDLDNDGLADSYDNDTSSVNPTNNQTPLDFPNEDNTNTTERDWRELPDLVVIIDNITVIEGNDLIFTISLVSLGDSAILKTSTTDVEIDISTSDGTDTTTTYDVAVSPYDYNGIASTSPNSIIIPIGDSTIQVTITSTDDTIDEIPEFFTINGLVTSANTTNPDTNLLEANVSFKGIGTIQDNDDAPDLIMNDDIQLEGDDLVHKVEINPSIANPTTSSSRPIEVEIITTDITAINPDDYTNTSPNTVTIPASNNPNNENTFVDFHIITIQDSLNEPDQETISVIGTVINGFVGTVDLDKTGTIIDRQPDPLVVISNPTIVEGGILEFTISLENPLTNEPQENYEDIGLNIFTNNGTAIEPDDYLSLSTQVVIPALTLSIEVQIQTNEDLLIEDVENLTLNGIITTFNTDNIEAEGIGTIIDNDLPNLFSPNNDGLSDEFEVISLLQYLDFKIQIFDRWGSEVYNYNNNGNTSPLWWNGTIKDEPVPEGVYYYTIDYNDGVTNPKSGFIQLIR